MSVSTDTWAEQSYWRSNAVRGSRKLLKALIRYHRKATGVRPAPKRRSRPPRCQKIAEIQRAVCSYYGVNYASFMSKRRDWHLSHPRQVAMYLARVDTGASFPLIGASFNRDHTTALYACREVEANPMLAEDIAEIRKLLVSKSAFPLSSPTPDSVERSENIVEERLAA
jgi:hypothetical protein